MPKIVLYLENCNPDAGFHYGRKEGGDLTFIYNRETARHECVFTLEDWRANNFFNARMLLDQPLVLPIFFDIQEDVTSVATSPAEPPLSGPVPAIEIQPEAEPILDPCSQTPPVRRARRARLTVEQKQAAQEAYDAQQKPSFIP